jgi:hypothetical protein
MLSELGRRVMAMKTRSFANNYKKSDLEGKIPDETVTAFNAPRVYTFCSLVQH